VDHVDFWNEHGDITQLAAYFNPSKGCLQGIKAVYGPNPADAQLVGNQKPGSQTQVVEAKLKPGEQIIQVQYKAGLK
jgi:hypothetical protein